MISKISGKVDNSINEIDILKALFPGGSITGAPKESAMKIIDYLEDYSRDIYTGSLGYIESNGNMNFNIAIRTMTKKEEVFSYGVGGGIVWDSIAENEWNEAQLKSKILSSIIK
jgi:anthranilate/para-aminobenzoate synthase component I